MKNSINGFLFVSLLLILGGCSPKYTEYSHISDFTQYVQSGFYIFPVGTEIKGTSYIPVADIELSFYTGKKPKNTIISELSTMKLSDGDVLYIPTMDYATKKIVESAKKYGANAIVNYQVIANRTGSGGVLSYKAKGVAVKIKM